MELPRRLALAAVLTVALAAGCEPGGDPERLESELMALHEARDYFALAERLDELGGANTPRAALVRAAVHHAFNDPGRSNALLSQVTQEAGATAALALRARRLEQANHLRLHRYPDALVAAKAALGLARSAGDADAVDDLENMVRLLRSLRDVPPQRVAVRGDTVLHLNQGRAEIAIDGRKREYLIDTGANFSVLMRSEAAALGLPIRDAGIEVGTSTDLQVHADLAVADRVTLGNLDYRHVVFLVFPDELLTIPDGPTIRGLIGFPLLEAAGELRFRKGGVVEIPAVPPPRAARNLALVQLMPLVRVGYAGDPLVCRFDTGANRTELYEPFYRRYRERVEGAGRRYLAKSAGVGGIREIPAYELPEVTLEIAGHAVTLEKVDVFTQSITDDAENDLHCNAGLDLLEPFEEYAVNFRSMSLALR